MFKAMTIHFIYMEVTQQNYNSPSRRKSQGTPSPHGPTAGLLAEGARPISLCFILVFHFRPKERFFGVEISNFSDYSTYLNRGKVALTGTPSIRPFEVSRMHNKNKEQ
jgi:hypothetical protein